MADERSLRRQPDGMTLDDLRATSEVLAGFERLGIEVGELESAPDDNTPPVCVNRLVDALDPILSTVTSPTGKTLIRLERTLG